MSNVLTTDNVAASSAEKRLLEIRAHLTPSEILDRDALQAYHQRLEKIWFECPAMFVQAASSTSVQRALIHAEIRRDIDRLKREVDEAVRKYRRQVHRDQRDLLKELNRQIDEHEGSSALKDACREVLKDPPGFDADLTALDISFHTQKAAKSCQALLKLMDSIVQHPPRRRSSSMNMQTPLQDHSLAKAERREVLVGVSGNHAGSHDAYTTTRMAARYGWQ
ncbi:hypothetical protein BCR35DRAFT_330128 [Leucosporidium creatinivorum]|uniref:Uncharacterized protein n=1 Tax=Leucosporidium creatinivorum TaxID=106004 RepID=A0A1Y2FWA0_9BASI|nr:hypothetical protein BCR35DRAFT_330128 [Leucosporidium creatinivorum]